jgi:two-component system, LytTR family, sensor kinase
MIGVWMLAILTPVVFWLSRRYPIERHGWARPVALHVVMSLGFALVDMAVVSLILPRLGVFPAYMGTVVGTFMFLLFVASSFHGNIFMYWVLLSIEHGLRHYRNYQERAQAALRLELQATELKARLAHEQLNALKMQLQPHFLFNTLNAIMVLVRQQKASEAEDMLVSLSDLLRCVLEDMDAQEVSLRRELEYLQLYLSIEQARFQDRLRVEISADPAVLDAAVPQMGLQPIVENAIRHGIGRRSAAGHLRISARRLNGSLEIQVEDDGPGFTSANPGDGRGIGLANTRARLHQLYNDSAQLILENGERGGALVKMILPYRRTAGISEFEVLEVNAAQHTDR